MCTLICDFPFKGVCFMVTVENHIGKISVTEKYLNEIVRHAVCDCFGVADVCNTNTFRSAVSSITKGRIFRPRGVVIRSDNDGGILLTCISR